MIVSCAELRDAFRRGERPAGADVARHVAECAACRELLSSPGLGPLLSAPEPAFALDPALEARVAGLLAEERGLRATLRALPTWKRVVLMCAAAALLPALQIWLRPSPGRGDWVAPFAAAFLMVCAVSLASARATPRWQKLGVLAVSAGLPALLWAVTATDEGALASPGLCFAYGGAFSLPLLGLFVLLERRERLGPLDAALLAGALGLVAAIVLEYHCSNSDRGHLLAGHASIGWAFVAVALGWTQLRIARER
jgi:hypothetical protein